MVFQSIPVFKTVSITSFNRDEALRYMGCRGEPDIRTQELLVACEELMRTAIRPRFLYQIFPLETRVDQISLQGCSLPLEGNDIRHHLGDCTHAALLCATLSAGADTVIRTAQVSDMAKALILDALASAAIEQVCDEAESTLKSQYADCYFTWRYSPGYGDFPITIQKDFLRATDAARKIGLTVSDSGILLPRKSVTAIIGLSPFPIEQKRRSCAVCNLRNTCTLRKRGDRCGL